MNNRLGRENRYPNSDDELETSQSYRQPRDPYGEPYQRPEQRDAGYGRPPYGRSGFDDTPSSYGSGWTGAEYGRSQGRESGGWSSNIRGATPVLVRRATRGRTHAFVRTFVIA